MVFISISNFLPTFRPQFIHFTPNFMNTPLKFAAALALVGFCLRANAQEGEKMAAKKDAKMEKKEGKMTKHDGMKQDGKMLKGDGKMMKDDKMKSKM